MTIDKMITKDVRPFINQDRPQTPEQIFSTNAYHKAFGSGHLQKPFCITDLEESERAEIFMYENENRRGILNMSDCGTGKTRGVLDFLYDLKLDNNLPPVLVLAPLSILEPAWGGDIEEWTPPLTYEPCYAKGREASFKTDVDVHIVNHDAVKWLMHPKQEKLVEKFKGGILVIDEFTAYKNMDSQRTQAALRLAKLMRMSIQLSGTPRPKSVLDIFTPALIADGGYRLGNNFYRFRHKVCDGIPLPHNPRIKKWTDKPDANIYVADRLRGITFRFKAKGNPLNTKRHMKVKLPKKCQKAYEDMVNSDLMFNEDGTPVNAVNAGVRYTKLLQLCTGAVYNIDGEVVSFHKERYELVLTLVREVEASLVGFTWQHEKQALSELFDKAGVKYAVIDGSVKPKQRVEIVKNYQNGEYDTLLCHPQSAGHGLTLTRGWRTIWCSLPNRGESFIQFNHRIDRKGQTKETETIMISAEGTKEEEAFTQLIEGKIQPQAEMLKLFAGG